MQPAMILAGKFFYKDVEMRNTKSFMAAVALTVFAIPMGATAQMNPNAVIGSASSVNGAVFVERSGQLLRVQNGSAIIAGDKVLAANGGSSTINLNGCNQVLSGGNMVSLASGNFCADLSSVSPIGPNNPFLSTVANTGGSIGAATPSIGTALPTSSILMGLAAAGAAYGLYQILDDEDDADTPTSP